VSLLIGTVGRYRGVEPRSKVSMMIMRPRQPGTRVQERLRPAVAAAVGLGRRTRWRRHIEQVPGSGDVAGAAAIGEEAVVADAVEAVGQNVDQEAADELVGGEGHHLGLATPLGPVILPPEGHAGLVEGEEPAVRDGDAWV
jgi:hypothetical protein